MSASTLAIIEYMLAACGFIKCYSSTDTYTNNQSRFIKVLYIKYKMLFKILCMITTLLLTSSFDVYYCVNKHTYNSWACLPTLSLANNTRQWSVCNTIWLVQIQTNDIYLNKDDIAQVSRWWKGVFVMGEYTVDSLAIRLLSKCGCSWL